MINAANTELHSLGIEFSEAKRARMLVSPVYGIYMAGNVFAYLRNVVVDINRPLLFLYAQMYTCLSVCR